MNTRVFTFPVKPIEAPGPRNNIPRIKMKHLRTLVGRLKPPKKSNREKTKDEQIPDFPNKQTK